MGIEKTRDVIVQTAQKLFARFGFSKTSMDEIARVSRKAKGSLYYHFSSKEDLFREVVQKEINEIKNQLEMLLSENINADEKLKKFLLVHCEMVVKAINYLEGIRADFDKDVSLIEDLRIQFIDWEKNVISQIIQEGIDSKIFPAFKNPQAVVSAIIHIILGLEISLFLFRNSRSENANLYNEIHLVIAGLKNFKE
ncbi:MAG: TetR/AcrR family transcriptional regulator [Bacteroidales bacterium]|nr:TetR/AcrR family transcriptional regulator [Bacteroidales bacterium]